MLAGIIEEAADRFGDTAAAVAAGGWSLTYSDLHALSDEAAVGLARRGVDEGDVVALCLPSTPDYLIAYAAVAKLGAVTAGINPRLAPAEREAALAVAAPRLVLATTDLLPREQGQVIEVGVASDPGGLMGPLRIGGGRPPRLGADAARPVAVVLTSGTTGQPKGALFTEAQLRAVAAMDSEGTWGGGSHVNAPTPFAHVGFMLKWPWQLRTGQTAHLLARWRPAAALRQLAELRMPIVAGVPPQLALMLRVPEIDDYDWSHVQGIVVGGGPATPALVDEATTRFGAPMSVRYSSTESGGVGCGTAFDADRDEALHTVGRPRGTVELSLRDRAGAEVGPGEVGEVCLRSGASTVGYWRDRAATEELFVDGFVRMGDLGRLDDAGRLHLVGRAREMFVRGGYNVYPMEVEATLADHPGVGEVAVVPRVDPVMGEIGVAVVVPHAGAAPPTLDELRRFAAARLASYKLPEVLETVAELPRTAMDKLDRQALARDHG